MSILRWIVALPFVVGAVLFALANPSLVSFTWSPFHDPKDLPLYFVAFMFLGLGFLIGVLMTWIGMSKHRAERRHLKKENKQLAKDINDANEKLTETLSQNRTLTPPPAIDYDNE